MGQNFNAVFSHQLDAATLRALPQALSPRAAPRLATALTHLAQTVGEREAPITPTLEGMANSDEAVVAGWSAGSWAGLGGLPLTSFSAIGPHTLCVYSVIRWGLFLTEPAVRQAMQLLCREIALILQSPRAVYLSDQWGISGQVSEGATLEQIVDWLRSHQGLPAPTIDAIYRELPSGSWSGDGYYIDTFQSLAEPGNQVGRDTTGTTLTESSVES